MLEGRVQLDLFKILIYEARFTAMSREHLGTTRSFQVGL